jgi:PAS domain S-box-containing protein
VKNKTQILKDICTDTLDKLPVAAIIFDNRRMHYINRAGLDILGIKNSGDFFKSKRSIFDFLLPQYHKAIRKNNEKILKGKSFERLEFEIKTPGGKTLYLESRSNCISFNGKKAIQSTIQEITKRKTLEEELFKTEELFSLLNKHTGDILFKFDFFPKPKCSYISDSFEKVFGHSKKDFMNDPAFYKKIIHPEDKKDYIFSLNDYKKFIRSKKNSTTFRYTGKTGNVIWLETIYSPIKDEKGKIVSMLGISRDVSHQKQTEADLDQTQEQFRIISDNAHDIIYFFTYNPKPKYLYISPSVEKVLGYSVDNFYKDPFFINKKTVGNINDLKKHERAARAQQKNGSLKQKRVVYQMQGHDGKEIWMEDHILPIKDASGKIKFVFGIVRNITELKVKERELNQKWSNYQALLDESPIAFFIHRNGYCEMCNKEAAKILAESSSEKIHGKYLINYIVPEQREQAVERLKDALSGEELDFIPYRVINAKKKPVNIELKSIPIQYNGQKCVLTIMRDVTNKEIYEKEKLRAELAEEHNKNLIKEIELRKKIEEKLIINEKQLINQATKLTAIFESSSHLVWTVNKDYALTYFNQNYARIFNDKYGMAPELGQQVFDLIPEQFKLENKHLWHTLYARVLKGEQIIFERQDKNSNGEEVYREVFLSPIKNEKGQVFEIACLAHDITENKRYEKQNVAQASKIKAIFESGAHIMWTVNKDMAYTSFNKNFSDAIFDLYGKRPELYKELTRPENRYSTDEYHEFWHGKYEEALKGKAVEFVSERTNTKGDKVYRQIYLHPIYNEREVIEVSGMGIDITDKILNEQKIINQAAKLNAVFEGSSHYIWTIDRNSKLTSFNKNFVDLIARSYKSEPKEGMSINAPPFVSNTDYNQWWIDQIGKALNGQRLNFETVFTDENENKTYLDVFLNPIYHDNRIIEVSGIAHDITERIQHEEQIKEQTAKLKAIFESGSQLIWTINRNRQITSFNKNYANAVFRLYGFYPEENKSIRELSDGATAAYQPFWDEKYDRVFSGTPAEFSTERINTDGSKVFRQYVLYPIKNNEGEVIEVSGMGIDITENKLYEEKITQSLKEKEVLLKEVHHRVKNNMQVISSILNLQSSYVTDQYALSLLKESQNRIKTMAYIHEALYQNKTFSSINFSEYISTLTNNILQSYAASIQKVRLVTDIQKIILNLDMSIPAGLIINELVTNSIKHAFTGSNEGNILINLHTKDNTLFLEVSDTGKGFPKDIDFKNTNSLGLQLVNTLVEQLNGKLELSENKYGGTSFYINFPM